MSASSGVATNSCEGGRSIQRCYNNRHVPPTAGCLVEQIHRLHPEVWGRAGLQALVSTVFYWAGVGVRLGTKLPPSPPYAIQDDRALDHRADETAQDVQDLEAVLERGPGFLFGAPHPPCACEGAVWGSSMRQPNTLGGTGDECVPVSIRGVVETAELAHDGGGAGAGGGGV